ncbi:MAG: helix-turn-helix domain-containing protein [Oscillospiraceae bacterium]|nr:helix-turn-helix domain-containing protein [Oscillospiraceae bacterium]
MSFGNRLRDRRKELGYSQGELAEKLGVSLSAISNYENGLNAMREDVLLRLFRVLDVEPNYLYQDDFSGSSFTCSVEEERLVKAYRNLRLPGKQTLRAMADALTNYQEELDGDRPVEETRQIPLYCNPAAAGYASPVFGEDFDYIDVTGETPRGAEFAVRIQGDSMEPHIRDGSIVYVNRDPLTNGDVGIFCVDGEMLCKQYVRDPLGIVYLFSLNRKRADADVVLPRDSGRTMVCFGRVLLKRRIRMPGVG